jgi:hypothetical protein
MKAHYLLILILLAVSCKEKKIRPSRSAMAQPTPFKREIPSFGDGKPDLFYLVDKEKQMQLGLDNLERGFDSLEIRIWYDFSFIDDRRLVVIRNKHHVWKAIVYNMHVDWDGQKETILSKSVQEITPASGWNHFSSQLMELKILDLPNCDKISGYEFGFDGVTFNVEFATWDQYRYYGYWEPRGNQDKFWQAKNMCDILDLLEEELGVSQHFGTRTKLSKSKK